MSGIDEAAECVAEALSAMGFSIIDVSWGNGHFEVEFKTCKFWSRKTPWSLKRIIKKRCGVSCSVRTKDSARNLQFRPSMRRVKASYLRGKQKRIIGTLDDAVYKSPR